MTVKKQKTRNYWWLELRNYLFHRTQTPDPRILHSRNSNIQVTDQVLPIALIVLFTGTPSSREDQFMRECMGLKVP
jgi:hypothetical protein